MNKKISETKAPEIYQKVWKACAAVPKGKVASYEYLARQIGNPKAARAVAGAMTANPFAPKVPCHRVVRKNGALGGYSAAGGLRTKRRLLELEGVKFSPGGKVEKRFFLT